jgi:hypothetical protein
MDLEAQRLREFRQYVENVLTTRYGNARLPAKVKQQEAPYDRDNNRTTGDFVNKDGVADAPVRLNLAYYDLTEEQGGLTPINGVIYLWVVREDGHLVIGVEDPSKWPAAFPNAPKEGDGLGHPTLGVRFSATGEALPGKGRIAGELEAHGGAWKINDHSGRYSAGRGQVLEFLLNAAAKFRRYQIDVQYIESKVEFPGQIRTVKELLATPRQAKL